MWTLTHHFVFSLLTLKPGPEWTVVLFVGSSSVQRSGLGSKAGTGTLAPSLTRTTGVSEATGHCSFSATGGAGAGGGEATAGGGTADLGLPVVSSSVPGAVCSVLRLSPRVSEGSVQEVVASEDGGDVGCLPVFFLPFVIPSVPGLLETVSFEALGREEVEEVDGEAEALEPVVFFE